MLDPAAAADAGVRTEQVDRTEAVFRVLDDVEDVRFDGDVRGHAEGGVTEFCGDDLHTVGIPVDDDHALRTRRTNWRHNARPMPPAPPVTTAT